MTNIEIDFYMKLPILVLYFLFLRRDIEKLCVSMQKSIALSNNKRRRVRKNDIFLQAIPFFAQKKYKCRLLTFLQKTSKFLQKFILYRKKYRKELLRNHPFTNEKAAKAAKKQKRLIIFYAAPALQKKRGEFYGKEKKLF